MLPMLLLALLVGGFWERIIAERRGRPMEPGFVLVALLFVLLLPGAAAFSHIIFGMSCAIILGKGIFGGEGKSFVNPALLGAAMVQVSYPAASALQPLWNGMAGYAGSDAIALYHRGGGWRWRRLALIPGRRLSALFRGPSVPRHCWRSHWVQVCCW